MVSCLAEVYSIAAAEAHLRDMKKSCGNGIGRGRLYISFRGYDGARQETSPNSRIWEGSGFTTCMQTPACQACSRVAPPIACSGLLPNEPHAWLPMTDMGEVVHFDGSELSLTQSCPSDWKDEVWNEGRKVRFHAQCRRDNRRRQSLN
jgi:hypothetical protein